MARKCGSAFWCPTGCSIWWWGRDGVHGAIIPSAGAVILSAAKDLVVVALGLSACGTDPGACTANIVSAVTVRALAAGTGENVTDGARGTVSEGTYVDSLRPAELDATQRVLLLSGADERPGTYDLFVERDGYQAVSLSGLEATSGECHVTTVSVNVTMVPIP
jgi:hypothetical protein